MKSAFVIASTHSGAGKTTVSAAIMAAFRRRGLAVQGFKVGPDFIDPGYHAAACGRPSRNLDGWMLARQTNLEIFARAARSADLAVVEGVMGLFDGASAIDESGSTAQMAKWLGLPIVLVIDAQAMSRSAAAIVRGFEQFDPDLRVAAVIVNRAASRIHYDQVAQAIRLECRAEPIGWLASDEAISIPSRHLGLVTAEEVISAEWLGALADRAQLSIDLDRLLAFGPARVEEIGDFQVERGPRVRIGVARDRAFCFYYQENLELLEWLGAELVFWSPLLEELPNQLHGLYFGGGYPELYADQLSANEGARRAVGDFIRRGGAAYAECGGLMYLSEAIVDLDGHPHPMVGALPAKVRMRDRLAAIGYFEVEGTNCAKLLARGEVARGHQFRHSEIDPLPSLARHYRLRGPCAAETLEGYAVGNCLASYVHIHFLSNPRFAARWLEVCRRSGVLT
jgi:cobyrinic acid a,c-diamide synthase